MKKLILLSFLLAATLIVNAQRGEGVTEARTQKHVEHLTEQLNLSEGQQAQLYDLFIARHQNRKTGGKKMRKLDQAEREAVKAERKAAKAEFDNQLASILTPAQLETFNNLPKGRRGEVGPKAGKGKRGKGKKGKAQKGKGKKNKANRSKATPEERAQKQTDRLTEKLALDANQQEAVYDLILNRATNNQKGTDWKALSKEERAALKGSKKKDKEAYEAELANILTPAQFETYQNLPKTKKGKKGKRGKKNKK